MDFYITSKSVRGSTISTITRIYAGRSGVQILPREKELSFLENIQASSITQCASNSMKTTAISVARSASLTTHILLQPSLSISGATPPFNLSASIAHIGTLHCHSNSYLCTYNPIQHISRFACPNLRQSKCSK